MLGVITSADVLAHPLIILREFGPCVLLHALTADPRETFLSVVARCLEEEGRHAPVDLDAERTVTQFIGFETRARDLYRGVAGCLASVPDAAAFFDVLSKQEEGHALVLSSIRRALRHGRLQKDPAIHAATVAAVEALLAGCEAEVARGIGLERALAMVETIECSEIDLAFDTLASCLEPGSRAHLERFFTLGERHAVFWTKQVALLRERHLRSGPFASGSPAR